MRTGDGCEALGLGESRKRSKPDEPAGTNLSSQPSTALVGAIKALQAELQKAESRLSDYYLRETALEEKLARERKEWQQKSESQASQLKMLEIQAEQHMAVWLVEETNLHARIEALVAEAHEAQGKLDNTKKHFEAKIERIEKARASAEKERAELEKSFSKALHQAQLEKERLSFEYQREVSNISQALDSTKAHLEESFTKIKQLQADYESAMKEIKKKYDKKLKSLEAKNESLQKELTELNEKSRKTVDQLSVKLHKESVVRSEVVKRLEADLELMRTEVECKASKLKEAKSNLHAELENTKKIAAELGSSKNKIRDLENKKTELEKQLSSLELYAGELSANLDGLKTDNKSLTVSIQKKELTIEQLKSQNTVLEKDLDYFQSTVVKELQDKLTISKEDSDKKKSKLQQKYQDKVAVLEQKLLETMEFAEHSQKTVKNLTTTLISLQESMAGSLETDVDLMEALG